MKEDIISLQEAFKEIKSMGLIKSLRSGVTGIGYTFETLLNKKEDQECKPDYKSIELKCRLGYSKSSLALFNCVPKRHSESAIKYIFKEYSHYRYNNENDYKLFACKVFCNSFLIRDGVHFRLKVDYYAQEVAMLSYKNNVVLEKVCSWDFKTLENKLKSKLKTLAIIEGYPYRKNNDTYYKYVKINIYRLKGFFEFFKLIENDSIYVNFYIRSGIGLDGEATIEDHGVAFKIKINSIEKLFYKIKSN